MPSYDIKHLPHSQCQLVITKIAPERLQKAEKKALAEFSSGLKLPGFRPGHIPEAKVREHIQEGALLARSIELAFPDEASDILLKEHLRVVGSPDTSIESIDPLRIVVTFDVYPEVKLGKYENLKVSVKEKSITKDDVEAAIADMQNRMAENKDVERAAKKGDRVELDFEGFTLDGVPLDNTKSSNHPVILGEGNLIPGFEDAVVGLKAGEEKDFEITFPKDYHAKNMAGKKVKFYVKAVKVQEVVPATVDEAFIAKVLGKPSTGSGSSEKLTVDEFKSEVEAELKTKAHQEYKSAYEDKYYEQLIKVCEIDPPKSMIESEKQNIMKELKQRILYSGGSYEEYLKRMGKTEETLLESFEEQSRGRVSLHLILQKIVDSKKIEVDELEIEQEITKMCEGRESDQQATIKKNYAKGTQGYILLTYQLKLRKVLDELLPFTVSQ
jgi:trigger factor